jgi:hypothetical protein
MSDRIRVLLHPRDYCPSGCRRYQFLQKDHLQRNIDGGGKQQPSAPFYAPVMERLLGTKCGAAHDAAAIYLPKSGVVLPPDG